MKKEEHTHFTFFVGSMNFFHGIINKVELQHLCEAMGCFWIYFNKNSKELRMLHTLIARINLRNYHSEVREKRL